MTAPLDLTQTPVTLPATVVPSSRTVAAGTGLTGGGNLTADRTLAVVYGTTAGTAAQGNDARLSDARTPTAHTHTGPQIMVSTRTVAYADLASLAPLSGVALDVITATLTGNQTIAPAAGTDGQILRIRMLASGAQRTPAVGTGVRLGTGIADRAMAIPSGQWGVFGLEYIGGLNLWVLFSEYVVSAS